MYAVTGNTYPHQQTLKAEGGIWDATRKAWVVSDEIAARIQSAYYGRNMYRTLTCTKIDEQVAS